MRDISKEFGLNYLIHKPSPPSYTLAELEELCNEWAIKQSATSAERWLVSCLLAWLAKREQGIGGER